MSRPITPLPFVPAYDLEDRPATACWLVESLWAREAVGILGGEPKCCKSLFALHLALAVASGRPCLGRFTVHDRGPVLVHPAEDAGHIVRQRLLQMATSMDLDLRRIPVQVGTAPLVRLDTRCDCDRLAAAVDAHRPRLVILDPFVRLHSGDENAAADIARILAELRDIQRQCHTAILVVHHARKGGGSRAGQALRGSSEFHAWGDCNLYLRWRQENLILSAEHRAAAAPPDIRLVLDHDHDRLQLRPQDDHATDTASPPDDHPTADAILAHLAAASTPLDREAIRKALKLRNATIGPLLRELIAAGQLAKDGKYYHLPLQQLTLTA